MPADNIEPTHAWSDPLRVRVEELLAVERFLVGSWRYWFAGLEDAPSTWQRLGRGFERAGLDAALCAFERAFNLIALTRTRELDLHATASPWLGADEARLLHVIAALQRGQTRCAAQTLSSMVAGRGVAGVVTSLARAAAVLDGCGHRLLLWSSRLAQAGDSPIQFTPPRPFSLH